MPEAIPLCALSRQISHAKRDRGSPETPAPRRNATGWRPSRAGRHLFLKRVARPASPPPAGLAVLVRVKVQTLVPN